MRWVQAQANYCRTRAMQGGEWGEVWRRIADEWDRLIAEFKNKK